MRNISDKNCTQNQNTYFMFNKFFPENRAVYEVISKKYGGAREAQLAV